MDFLEEFKKILAAFYSRDTSRTESNNENK